MKKFISLDTKLCLLIYGLYLEVAKKISVLKRVIYLSKEYNNPDECFLRH